MSESKKTPDEYTIEDRERSSVIFLIDVSEQQILRYALKWSEWYTHQRDKNYRSEISEWWKLSQCLVLDSKIEQQHSKRTRHALFC